MKIELKHKILNDKYTEYVYDAYDIQNKEESNVTIDNNIRVDDFDWNIGVIYGGSGTGKSTLLKTFGEIATPIFDNEKSLISNFDWMTPEEATHLLSAMGLSSVPTWLRQFKVMLNSTVEKEDEYHPFNFTTFGIVSLVLGIVAGVINPPLILPLLGLSYFFFRKCFNNKFYINQLWNREKV
jgi:energy-coupling factor transporter ATP-binding protein EcfA2